MSTELKISRHINMMLNYYHDQLDKYKSLVKNQNKSSSELKELWNEILSMKKLLEASGMFEFYSDNGCNLNTSDLFLPIENNETEITLPGAMTIFKSSSSSGSHENSYGNGEINLCLQTNNPSQPWISLGQIYFASPTKDQLEKMETAPSTSHDYLELCTMKRRLSKKQAHHIQKKISNFISDEFKGCISPDDEIDFYY